MTERERTQKGVVMRSDRRERVVKSTRLPVTLVEEMEARALEEEKTLQEFMESAIEARVYHRTDPNEDLRQVVVELRRLLERLERLST